MSAKQIVSGTLKGRLKLFLEKKAQAAKLEKELKELKALIDADLDVVAGKNGFMNGKLGLPTLAMVSVTLNPAKLVWAKTQESLKPEDREGVALILPDKYVIQDVRVADLFKAVERGGNDLSALLAGKGISVIQESRFDIKAA